MSRQGIYGVHAVCMRPAYGVCREGDAPQTPPTQGRGRLTLNQLLPSSGVDSSSVQEEGDGKAYRVQLLLLVRTFQVHEGFEDFEPDLIRDGAILVGSPRQRRRALRVANARRRFGEQFPGAIQCGRVCKQFRLLKESILAEQAKRRHVAALPKP